MSFLIKNKNDLNVIYEKLAIVKIALERVTREERLPKVFADAALAELKSVMQLLASDSRKK